MPLSLLKLGTDHDLSVASFNSILLTVVAPDISSANPSNVGAENATLIITLIIWRPSRFFLTSIFISGVTTLLPTCPCAVVTSFPIPFDFCLALMAFLRLYVCVAIVELGEQFH